MIQLGRKSLYRKGQIPKEFRPVPSRRIMGQEKAVEALNFAVNLPAPNAHLICLGPKGVGRTSLTLNILQQFAENRPTPKDWVYVANFNHLAQPKPIAFPAGEGEAFAHKMARATQGLRADLKAIFSDESYQIRVAHIKQKYAAEKQADFNRLADSVAGPFTMLAKNANGIVVTPIKDGTVLTPDVFNNLPVEERKFLLGEMKAAQVRLEKALTESSWDAEKEDREVAVLNVQIAEKRIRQKWATLHKNYDDVPGVESFLNEAKAYVLEHLDAFLAGDENAWRLLKVNSFVCHHPAQGAPVIAMGRLTAGGLLGKIERIQENGTLICDHTLIQPGALHLANGGFLLIEGKELLESPQIWSLLKQALYTHKIQMEPSADEGVFAARMLQPQPIPLNVKVILVGDMNLYYALTGKEEDFEELFKFQVRFNEKTDRTPVSEQEYANVLADFVKQNGLLGFDVGAYNKLTEFAARLAQDQNALSMRLARVHDLMREADFVARETGAGQVTADVIEKTENKRFERLSCARSEWLENVRCGLLKLTLSGFSVGQINALVVHELGAFQFGRPSRVTCRVRLGGGTVADIEREVSLGGTLHSKGVLILGAYLSARYGQEYTLPIDASLPPTLKTSI